MTVLGAYEEPVQEALERAASDRLAERIWARDPGVWKSDPALHKEIVERLGWLDAPFQTEDALRPIVSFAEEAAREFKSVVLMGMGGSSLAPELFSSVFKGKPGRPELRVLDSTDPESVLDVARAINLPKTLFIFASKSGTTTEPLSFYKYFRNEAKRLLKDRVGRNFIAITDPGAPLEELARKEGFRKVFLADPSVGGRYSALTPFGLVPAALIGADIAAILAGARRLAELSRKTGDPASHPALPLGVAMGFFALRKRDKLTLLVSKGLEPFGDWVEQLVAESTGKEGKGVVPVIRESALAPQEYGPDRLFVTLTLESKKDKELQGRAAKLAAAGHPVLSFRLPDIADLGGELFRWEMATAIAGAVMKINPFDQPDVQSAKDKTKELLQTLAAGRPLPLKTVPMKWTPFNVSWSRAVGDPEGKPEEAWPRFWKSLGVGEAAHLLAFLPARKGIREGLEGLRAKVRKLTKAAVTVGIGPRYLHSTGQLHKGGPDKAIFLVIVAPRKTRLPVPGDPYTFEQLELAQAVGDFQALDSKGRRAFFVELPDFSKSLGVLESAVDKAFRR